MLRVTLGLCVSCSRRCMVMSAKSNCEVLAQVKQRDERRIVGSNSGTPEGIMGGVGLQGHAMFSTRRDFNVQVCRCQPETIIDYACACKYTVSCRGSAPVL